MSYIAIEVVSLFLFVLAIWLVAFVFIGKGLLKEFAKETVMFFGVIALIVAIVTPFVAFFNWLAK